jgi:hypothetical protein
MDIEALQRDIEAAVRAAFAEMVRLHGDEGIYAFALYSDEGAMTVCPSTNTQAHLAGQEGADAYARFAPAEWKYEMQGADDAFNAISTLAREHVFSLGEDQAEEFAAIRENLFDACVAVLEKLQREDFFLRTAGEEVFLTFTVSDYEFEPGRERDIITRLNRPRYRDEYLAWMESRGE